MEGGINVYNSHNERTNALKSSLYEILKLELEKSNFKLLPEKRYPRNN
jgi:hypothetical protein